MACSARSPNSEPRRFCPSASTSVDVEQVTEGAEAEHLAPPSPSVFLRVVEHVAALAECREVAGPVVAWVVVQMRAGQDHARDRKTWGRGDAGEVGLDFLESLRWRQLADPSALAIAPSAPLCIPPGTVAQVRDVLPVRSAAALAAPLSAREADEVRELAPVDGIEPAVLRRDRHGWSVSPTPHGSNPDVLRHDTLPPEGGMRDWVILTPDAWHLNTGLSAC